jgi:hypothetical protein
MIRLDEQFPRRPFNKEHCSSLVSERDAQEDRMDPKACSPSARGGDRSAVVSYGRKTSMLSKAKANELKFSPREARSIVGLILCERQRDISLQYR